MSPVHDLKIFVTARAQNSVRNTLLLRAEQNRSGRGRPADLPRDIGMDATSENRPGETELPSIRAVGLWKNSGQAGERLALLVLEAADPRGPDATRSGSTAGNRSGQVHFANVARLGHV